MRIFITILVTVAVFLVIGLLVVFTGAYNVSAAEGHWGLTRWALVTVTENSIQSHGSEIAAPELTAEMAERGAGSFDGMCAMCHGAPGVARAEFAKGLLPLAPELSDEAEKFSAGELFWTVKNGIKFTGMPAFGETHDDAAIWDVVAFVETLPGMSAETYADVTAAAGEHEHGGHEHESSSHGTSATGESAGDGAKQDQEDEHEHATIPHR